MPGLLYAILILLFAVTVASIIMKVCFKFFLEEPHYSQEFIESTIIEIRQKAADEADRKNNAI